MIETGKLTSEKLIGRTITLEQSIDALVNVDKFEVAVVTEVTKTPKGKIAHPIFKATTSGIGRCRSLRNYLKMEKRVKSICQNHSNGVTDGLPKQL
jgi:hypothetical protein